MYMLMVVRNQNKDTMDRLQLLQLSRLPKNAVPALNSQQQELLLGMREEIRTLLLLGKNGLKLQKETNERRWKTLAIVGFVWNCVLWLSYVTWIGSVVFTETCQSGTRGICFLWVVLLFSSFIRFSVPVSIVMRFLVVCDVVMDKIDMWFELHRGQVNIEEVCVLLGYNMAYRRKMAHQFQFVFITMFILPIFTIVLAFIANVLDPGVLAHDYFFLIWSFHYALLACVTFRKAAQISSKGKSLRSRLIERMACGQVTFTNPPEQIRAYKEFLSQESGGFRVFGIEITESLLSKIVGVLITLLTFLSDNLLKS